MKIHCLLIWILSFVYGFGQAGFFGGGQVGVLTYSLNGAADVNSWNWNTTLTDVRTLVLKGGYTHTWKGSNGNVCNGKIYYRVYRQDQTPGSFLGPIILSFSSNNGFTTTATPSNISGNNSGDQRWVNISEDINIAAFANTPGTWVLEVYFQADGSTSNSSDCTTDVLTDNNGGQNYKIFFDRMINPGFERIPPSSFGWSFESGSTIWTLANTGSIRSGVNSARVEVTTFNERFARHNSGYFVRTPQSGTNYVHVIGWALAGTTGDQIRMQGLSTDGGTQVLGTFDNFTNTNTWQRFTTSGLASNDKSYFPGFQVKGNYTISGGDIYRFDDIIIYTSTSAGVDLTKPNSPSNLQVSRVGNNNSITWTDGADAAANSSGIEGTLILRTAGDKTASLAALQTRILDQAYYSTNTSIGPNTISDGTNTWTVISNAFFSGTFTDVNAPVDVTYAVVMRDRAFNYSIPVVKYCTDCSLNNYNTFASAVLFANCLSDTNFYNTSGDVENQIGTVALQNQNLGSFFQNSGDFILRGGELKTFKSNNANVCIPKLWYRIYSSSDLNPTNSFTSIEMGSLIENCIGCPGFFPSGGQCNGLGTCNDQKWQMNDAGVNLTNFSPGSYTIEVYFEILGNNNGSTGCSDIKYINNGGANFKANFRIIPTTSVITQNP